MADAETPERLLLVKNVSALKATYQVRLLTYRAAAEGRRLVIHVPRHCKVQSDLKKLLREHRRIVSIERS